MKFETLMLQSLFTVCLLICLLTLGSMLATPTTHLAASQAPAAAMTNAAR